MRRTINKLFIAGTLALALFATGCEKRWYDVNKDPNNPVESNITPDLVVPYALLNSANRVTTSYSFLGNWLGFWAPAANYAPNTEEQSYNITTNFNGGLFTGWLDNSYDYVFAEKRAKETNQTFYQGIAKMMKSHNFAQLVDIYNSVPYFDALKGLDNLQPKYDDGKTIYEDALKQIDTAIALIKASTPTDNLNLTNADIMFAGDKTLWVKFGNTLKLRLLMHQANRADRQAYIQAEIAKIVAEGTGFLGSGQDAAVNPKFQQDKPNSFYASYGFTQTGTQATDFWRANVIALNYLKNNFDTVRMKLQYKRKVGNYTVGGVQKPISDAPQPFTQPGDTAYRGNQYGLPINNTTYPVQTASYVSEVGGITSAGPVSGASFGLVKGYNQSAPLLTSVESMFLQAEAVERGYLAGDKETAYKNAVRESFIWLNAGPTRDSSISLFNKFYAGAVTDLNPNVSYVSAPDKLKLIIFQKYLALNGLNFLEVWTDYRRFGGYPNIPLSVNPGRTSNILPVSLLYPQSEININKNVPSAGRKSGDQFTNKIWWMP